MPLILLLTSWQPSQLLLETGDASSRTHKGRTYPLLQVCVRALCWAGLGTSPNQAQAVPKRTTLNPAAACPGVQDGGQQSWS